MGQIVTQIHCCWFRCHTITIHIFMMLLTTELYIKECHVNIRALRVLSWRLKIGLIWGIFETEDLKIHLFRFDDLKTVLFCHFYPRYLKIWRQTDRHFKPENSKDAFMCWEPHIASMKEQINVNFRDDLSWKFLMMLYAASQSNSDWPFITE